MKIVVVSSFELFVTVIESPLSIILKGVDLNIEAVVESRSYDRFGFVDH